jgi:hypothetical protein
LAYPSGYLYIKKQAEKSASCFSKHAAGMAHFKIANLDNTAIFKAVVEIAY